MPANHLTNQLDLTVYEYEWLWCMLGWAVSQDPTRRWSLYQSLFAKLWTAMLAFGWKVGDSHQLGAVPSGTCFRASAEQYIFGSCFTHYAFLSNCCERWKERIVAINLVQAVLFSLISWWFPNVKVSFTCACQLRKCCRSIDFYKVLIFIVLGTSKFIVCLWWEKALKFDIP